MRVCIVGAGFSGLALACQLVEQRAALTELVLIGSAEDFARGRAYADADPLHRLNVRASQMGLHPQQPGEFADWLGLGGADRESYLARGRYGDYLQHRLEQARAQAGFRFDCRPARVQAVTRVEGGYRLQLRQTSAPDAEISADRVVLALGSPLGDLRSSDDPACIDDPWSAWLLNLESAITPYSRIIVLAAVIAAMGLTIVLLRGGPTPTESPSLSPQLSADGGGDSLVATEMFATPAIATASMWPTSTPPSPTGELLPLGAPTAATSAVTTPVNSATVAPSPVASAAGPASAWRGPAGARLTGQVLPVEGADRVNVAEVPSYPTTSTR